MHGTSHPDSSAPRGLLGGLRSWVQSWSNEIWQTSENLPIEVGVPAARANSLVRVLVVDDNPVTASMAAWQSRAATGIWRTAWSSGVPHTTEGQPCVVVPATRGVTDLSLRGRRSRVVELDGGPAHAGRRSALQAHRRESAFHRCLAPGSRWRAGVTDVRFCRTSGAQPSRTSG